jgi:hypothetical protein
VASFKFGNHKSNVKSVERRGIKISFLLISFRYVSFRFVSFRFYFVSHFIGTLPHHATINLLNYGNILQNLKKVKGKRNQQKRNETKQNQRNENEIKRNQRKQNEINENKAKYDARLLPTHVSVSFLLISFRFVSFRFVFVNFVSFRFVSFLFRFALYRYPSDFTTFRWCKGTSRKPTS